MSERGVVHRLDRLFMRYVLVTSGWMGLLAGFAAMFSVIDGGTALPFLLFAAAVAALHGHHGLNVGWFDYAEADAMSDGDDPLDELD